MGKLEEETELETAKGVLVVFLLISRVFASACLAIRVWCAARVSHVLSLSITLLKKEKPNEKNYKRVSGLRAGQRLESRVATLTKRALRCVFFGRVGLTLLRFGPHLVSINRVGYNIKRKNYYLWQGNYCGNRENIGTKLGRSRNEI